MNIPISAFESHNYKLVIIFQVKNKGGGGLILINKKSFLFLTFCLTVNRTDRNKSAREILFEVYECIVVKSRLINISNFLFPITSLLLYTIANIETVVEHNAK